MNAAAPARQSAAVFGLAAAFFFWQLRHPFLRFDLPLVNDVVGFALGLYLPWMTAVALFRSGVRWRRAIALIVVAPLLLFSAAWMFGGTLAVLAFFNGRSLTLHQFAVHAWKGSEICLYRTDGGATTDYGVVLRQERTVLPGLRLVRRIDDFYPCYSLEVASTGSGITVNGAESGCILPPDKSGEYRLKQFVYF